MTELKWKIESNIIVDFNKPLLITEPPDIRHKKTEDLSKTRPNAPYRHIMSTLLNSNRIHILQKCTWNILHDRSCMLDDKVLTNLKRLKGYEVSVHNEAWIK